MPCPILIVPAQAVENEILVLYETRYRFGTLLAIVAQITFRYYLMRRRERKWFFSFLVREYAYSVLFVHFGEFKEEEMVMK